MLVEEVLATLRPQPGDIVADCTIGYGGHALEFIIRIGPTGRLIGFDVDAVQLERTANRLASFITSNIEETAQATASTAPFALHRSHFAGLGKFLVREKIDGYDIVFADLGVSSMQIDDSARGFSYKYDGPLDMRMDDRLPRNAADYVAKLSAKELSECLAEFGNEPHAQRIAERIVRHRTTHPITRTGQLVRIVFEAKGISPRAWRNRPAEQRGQLHPVAKTFQALRILVNDELAGLTQFLRIAPHCMKSGARIGIISFHEGEDRLVENSFRDGLAAGTFSTISETAIRPSSTEINENPRSRSAKLRGAVRAKN